ncbi:hypothetical protein ONE63_005863 [Megalurothrips usitatus]|uniref:RHD domain-containing protein n=1 Tax=Megalurothrips usitatus TaxID=439358 RepID=A0AAV7Y0Y1_9NEOP|nr:hypothetical protein ONE63_005863 [Megalurothrips usitatus]
MSTMSDDVLQDVLSDSGVISLAVALEEAYRKEELANAASGFEATTESPGPGHSSYTLQNTPGAMILEESAQQVQFPYKSELFFPGTSGPNNDVLEDREPNAPSEFEARTETGCGSYIPPNTPRIKILEEPAQQVRFRYESEKLFPGTPGQSSNSTNKTFPTIQIQHYKGPSIAVVVSCVSKDLPVRAHPHSLVGENCKDGIFRQRITSDDMDGMTISFPKLNIQCTKKKNVKEKLMIRQKRRVDPFEAGFAHCEEEIDMDSVRLCFQVFLHDNTPLKPVVSQPIFNRKLFSNLNICEISYSSASVEGGKKRMLFCDKINKDDIEIVFFEETDGIRTWEACVDIKPSHVHRGCGIIFETPAYKNIHVDEPVLVYMQLRQRTTKATGEPRVFTLTPKPESPRKKRRYDTTWLSQDVEKTLLGMIQKQSVAETRQPIPDAAETLSTPAAGQLSLVCPNFDTAGEAAYGNAVFGRFHDAGVAHGGGGFSGGPRSAPSTTRPESAALLLHPASSAVAQCQP